MKEKTILFLTHLFPNSVNPKQGTFMRNKVLSLKRAGCRVIVVAPVPWAPYPLNRLTRYRQYSVPERTSIDQGVEVHYPKFLRLPGAGFRPFEGRSMFLASRRLIRRLHEQYPFDVVIGGMLTNDGAAARDAGVDLGIPAYSYAIGSDIHTYPKRESKVRALTETLFRDLEGVISVGPNFEKIINREFPGFEGKVFCNPIGVDVDLFRPGKTGGLLQELGCDSEFRIALFVGELSREKGVEELMRLIPKMAKEKVVFLLVGKGPLLEQLCSRIEKEVDFQNCRVFSYLGFDELIRFYQNSDFFLFPSHNEGSPTVLIEAAACGLPILASDIPPNHDVVSEGENGWFFSVGSVDSMEDAVRKILQKTDSKIEGEKSREIATRHFDQERNGHSLVTKLFS